MSVWELYTGYDLAVRKQRAQRNHDRAEVREIDAELARRAAERKPPPERLNVTVPMED
jgi:hypothetical protein